MHGTIGCAAVESEKTSVEKRMWTTCIKECISTFYTVNQHIEVMNLMNGTR